MKPDEFSLLVAIYGQCPVPGLYRIGRALGIPRNRVRYLSIQKWCRKGWYEYGVSENGGWLTLEGEEAVREAVSR